ncbi:M48 family metalloprotease [Streptomyces pini]|uniref:Zn-dependent protease with chaperone function n=1 Tax=Streptomyces pini TaxID=1520580 RepID=A0A1I3TTE4_9ACTN|nr:M48 family metallopeptidase [Streptomyces pini]SFJ73902.1 Zn-dependent protease with chaperone function [Streptomyces pini]
MRTTPGALARTALALVLVGGFHAVSWALVLGYAALSAFVLWSLLVEGARMTTPAPLYMIAFGLPAVLAVLRGLFSGGRTPAARRGRAVTRRQAPRLWETVTGLARAVGAPEPTEIRLTLEANASVGEDTRFGAGVAARRMEIGVPLLAGLSEDELRAVLCHELGHYARRHTRFAATAHRGSAALRTARDGIAEAAGGNFLVASYTDYQRWVLGAYAWLFDAVTFVVRRRQEFQADEAAAAVVGREATASALTAVHAVGAAWADYRARLLDPMAGRGLTPDDPLRPFAEMLADPDYAEALGEWRRRMPEPPRSRLDSHPPLSRRLAALAHDKGAPDAPPAPETGRAADAAYLRLPEGVWGSLLRPLLPPSGPRGPGRPWREWLDDAAEAQMVQAVEDLREPLARLLGPDVLPDPSVEAVLGLLEAGRGAELAEALHETGWGTDQWGLPGSPAQALEVLVGQGLTSAGRAGWSLRWTGPSALVAYDGEAREAVELARAAAADPAAVPPLRTRLVLCGVNTAAPLDRTGPVARPTGGAGPTAGPTAGPATAGSATATGAGAEKPGRLNGKPGMLVAAVVVAVVFSWNLFTGDDVPERPSVPGTPVAPLSPRSSSPLPYPPAECGPREIRLAGDCVPFGDLVATPGPVATPLPAVTPAPGAALRSPE